MSNLTIPLSGGHLLSGWLGWCVLNNSSVTARTEAVITSSSISDSEEEST